MASFPQVLRNDSICVCILHLTSEICRGWKQLCSNKLCMPRGEHSKHSPKTNLHTYKKDRHIHKCKECTLSKRCGACHTDTLPTPPGQEIECPPRASLVSSFSTVCGGGGGRGGGQKVEEGCQCTLTPTNKHTTHTQ